MAPFATGCAWVDATAGAVVINDGPGAEIIVPTPSRRSPTRSNRVFWPPQSRSRLPRGARCGTAAELVGLYQTLVTDLGGLVVEMARQGFHNHALVERRAADVVELERRIAELDSRIVAAGDGPRPRGRPPLMAQIGAAAPPASPCPLPRAARQRRELLCLLEPAGAPVTDDEALEEPDAQERCPACLAAVDPDQQYCLQCGERLAPAGPPPSSPLRGRSRPPAAAVIAAGALLLLLGGFGIAYGFTRDDSPEAAGTTITTGSSSVPSCRPPCPSRACRCRPSPTSASTGTFRRRPPAPAVDRTTPTVRPGRPGRRPTRPRRRRLAAGPRRLRVILVGRHREVHVRVDHGQAAGHRQGLRTGVLNSTTTSHSTRARVLYLGPYSSKSSAQAAQAEARADNTPTPVRRRRVGGGDLRRRSGQRDRS
jgi:hypothetical protein